MQNILKNFSILIISSMLGAAYAVPNNSEMVNYSYNQPNNSKANNSKANSNKNNGCGYACVTNVKREPRPAPPPVEECCPLPKSKYAIPMQGTKYNWSFGADVFYMYGEAKGEYHQIFRSEKVGGTIYLQQRFRNPFGWELGYSWTDRKPKPLYVVPGTVIFNTTATAASDITGRLRLKITYLDFHAHVPLCKFVESKFILGVGWVRQGIQFTYVPNITGEPVQNTLSAFEGRTAVTVRVGVGAQALITKRWGTRFIILYESMSNIKIRGTPYGVNQKIMNDSLSLIWGLYFTFQGLRTDHDVPDLSG